MRTGIHFARKRSNPPYQTWSHHPSRRFYRRVREQYPAVIIPDRDRTGTGESDTEQGTDSLHVRFMPAKVPAQHGSGAACQARWRSVYQQPRISICCRGVAIRRAARQPADIVIRGGAQPKRL